MNKGLEALSKLFVLSSEYHQKLWCLKLAPVYPEVREKYIDRIVECLPNDGGELNDLYNYIEQALKRNEPKKVAMGMNDYIGRPSFEPVCPICGQRLTMYETEKYCPNCGQKLDWGKSK